MLDIATIYILKVFTCTPHIEYIYAPVDFNVAASRNFLVNKFDITRLFNRVRVRYS